MSLRRIVCIAAIVGSVAIFVALVWAQAQFPFFLQYVVICRYPLASAVLLLLLPAICALAAPRLLRSLIIVRTTGVFPVSLVATLVGQAIGSTIVMFLLRSMDRFPVRAPHRSLATLVESGLHLPFPWLVLGLAAPIIGTVCLYVPVRQQPVGVVRWLVRDVPTRMVMAFLGVVCAMLVVSLGVKLSGFVGNTATRHLRVQDPMAWQMVIGGGYFSIQGGEPIAGTEKVLERGEIFPAHLVLTAILIANLLVYALGAWLLYPDARSAWRQFFQRHVPALTYVLLTMLVITYFGAGASFFLDYFFVPPLLVFAVTSAVLYAGLRMDHVFYLQTQAGKGALPANAGLQQWVERERSRLKEANVDRKPILVVVAANGGGILAAAWTARVLCGLYRELPHFSHSMRLISAVSGGSVGTLFFTDGVLAGQGKLRDATAQRIVTSADASSLESTAWGVTYPDLGRAFFAPLGALYRSIDRGWAIEQSWRRRLHDKARTLESLRAGLVSGSDPAVIFNSTVVQTGERFLFSIVETRSSHSASRARQFHAVYGDADISLVTAARMSATFPYVSPIARASSDATGVHLADGGYFDNFGVTTAVEWLEAVLPDIHQDLEKVKFIHIRSGPEASDGTASPRTRGWVYSVFGPLLAIVQTWARTQEERNSQQLRSLVERWSGSGLQIDEVEFEYKDDSAPLSWELKRRDRQKLDDKWQDYLLRELPGLSDLR